METVAPDSLALKEWAAVILALLEGRQDALLRKGGIHERAFDPDRSGWFLLYPTVEHSHRDRIRPEHHDLVERGAADVAEDRVLVRTRARILEVREVYDVADLADLRHIYTDGYLAERLAFRPRHPLRVLRLDVVPIDPPLRLARTPDHAGCRSWIELGSPSSNAPGSIPHP